MQPNSDKQDNNYNSKSIYPSYQATPPPLYSPYPQQVVDGAGYATSDKPCNGQTPLHQQKEIVIAPGYQTIWNNKLATPITNSLRMFLIISGFIYSMWGILAFSLQTAIVANSFSTYYHGFLTGGFLIIGGIVMMIVAFRSYYSLVHLERIYAVNLSFCIIGLIFSIINYKISTRCTSLSSFYCDDNLASNLKVTLLVVFIFSLIHTITNMLFISKEHQRTLLRSNSSYANH